MDIKVLKKQYALCGATVNILYNLQHWSKKQVYSELNLPEL
jgi:hypothetical protein